MQAVMQWDGEEEETGLEAEAGVDGKSLGQGNGGYFFFC